MKIAFGCDPNAEKLKLRLMRTAQENGHEIVDMGSEDPIYGHTAIAVGEYVAAGSADRGVLVCGTGLGMSIAANKVQGIYATLLTDVYSAKRAVMSNNSNVACFGAFTIGERLAEELLNVWLACTYQPGCASQPKVDCYQIYDNNRGHLPNS